MLFDSVFMIGVRCVHKVNINASESSISLIQTCASAKNKYHQSPLLSSVDFNFPGNDTHDKKNTEPSFLKISDFVNCNYTYNCMLFCRIVLALYGYFGQPVFFPFL